MASVNWGLGSLSLRRGRAKTPRSNEQLTNEERKQRGLPHDGAKQAAKDRRRMLVNESLFEARFTDNGWDTAYRAGSVIVQAPR